MKIAVDMTPVENDPAGIGLYIRNLIYELLVQDKHNQYLLFFSKKTGFPALGNNTKVYIISRNKLPVFRGIMWMLKVRQKLFEEKADLLLSTTNMLFSFLFPKTIQFIYDLGPVLFPAFYTLKARISFTMGLKLFVQRATKIITISKQVAKEIKTNLKLSKQINIVYPCFNENVIRSNRNPGVTLPEKYFLSISTLQPRKNYKNIILAFYELQKRNKLTDYKYIIIGQKGWLYKELFTMVKNLGLEDKICFQGYVKDEYLNCYYKNAKGIIYTSFYEGFGMVPLEAMYYTKPLLVSDIPVFHEACGQYPLYAKAGNPKDIAEKIIKLTGIRPDDKIVQNLFSTYNWKKSAKRLLRIINETE